MNYDVFFDISNKFSEKFGRVFIWGHGTGFFYEKDIKEDEAFDLNEITLSELKQFPNLKKATIMSSNFDKIKETFDAADIEVELL